MTYPLPEPWRQLRACLHAALAIAAGVATIGVPASVAAPFPSPPPRSISSSKQFLVFSPDVVLRRRIANFAEEVKTGFVQLLGEPDRWRAPILITLDRAKTNQAAQDPARFDLIQNEAGFKIEITVRLGDDPVDVNLQKLIVRALYVEFAYRFQPQALEDGKAYAQAPWWLVEGTIQALRSREGGVGTDIFKRIIDINRLPPLVSLLGPHPEDIGGAAAQAVDAACAYCLLQLLLEQPASRPGLASYVRHLPTAPSDQVAALRRDFPTLGTDPAELQKWWTLNLARLAAADRYKGLSPEETDSMLAALLQFEIPGNKGTPAKVYDIADFQQYLKLDAARGVLAEKHAALIALSTRANALYSDIVADYEMVFAHLTRGKSRGMKERLEKVAAAREFLLHRKAQIADYLNWYEATKLDPSRRAFDGYMKVARELDTPLPRRDPISQYLDEYAGKMKK